MPSITNLSKCQDKLTDRYEDKLIEFIKWISSCEKKCIKDMCDEWVPYICKIFPEQCEDLKKEVGLEEFCEEFIVDKRTEKEKNIENKCHNLLKNLCKTPSKECEDLQKMCKEKLRQDTCKEIQKNILQKFFKESPVLDDNISTEFTETIFKQTCNKLTSAIEECEANDGHQKYLTLRYPDGLYIEEVLRAFYPDLSQEMINKIVNEEYHVKQFGVTVNYYDNGKYCTLTDSGNINKDCISIQDNKFKDCVSILPNTLFTESYNLKSDAIHCGKHIFNRDTYITISKALRHDETIDQIEPLVTVSQSQPLVIANVYNGKLIKKDGTVTKMTLNGCKEFCDNNGSITACTDKGEECYTCQDSMYDFQGEIPVYMI